MMLTSESVLQTLCLCAYVGIISGAGITEFSCGTGQFINTVTGTCEKCPVGHYMSEHKHQNVDCKPCSVASSHRHEVVAEICSPLADAVIECADGYYKRALTSFKTHQEFDCNVCSDCGTQQLHEVRSCDRLNDAVCCPHPDMTAVWTGSRWDCEPPGADDTWRGSSARDNDRSHTRITSSVQPRCGVNTFLKVSDDGARCMPCPEGTYIQQDQHALGVCVPGNPWVKLFTFFLPCYAFFVYRFYQFMRR